MSQTRVHLGLRGFVALIRRKMAVSFDELSAASRN